MIETLLTLDGSVLLWIQENLRADWLTPSVLVITKLGNTGLIWILISLCLLCFKKTRWAGAAGILGLLFSLVFNNVFLKNLFMRTRPYEVVEGLYHMLPHNPSDFSFPSGHTGSSFACAMAVFWTLRGKGINWRWLLVAFAAVMGLTRLYVGVHFPTDVVCGGLTGTLCGYVSYRIILFSQQYFRRQQTKQRQ